MKKYIGIVVGILIAALVVYALMPKKRFVSEMAMGLENLVPKEAVAYYSIKDLRGTWETVSKSNFWKQLSGLQIWKDLKAQDNLSALSKTLKDSLGFELTESRVMDFIGEEAAIAVVIGARNDTEPKILLLTKTGLQTQIAETAAKLIEKAKGGGTAIETWKYANVELTHVKSADPTAPELNYVFLKGVLVLGVGKTKEALEKVVDIYNGKTGESLAQSKDYQRLNTLCSGVGKNIVGKFFMDFEKISQSVGGINIPVPGAAGPTNIAAPLSMLKTIGGVTWMDNGINTKIFVVPNKANMDEATRTLWDVKPQKAGSLDLIPEGTVLYSVSNSIDVAGLWKIWQNNLSKSAPDQAKVVTDAIAQAEKTMGMTIEGDIIPWIGDEIGYTFNDVNVEGIFPIPKMALIIKVKDEAKARKFLDKMVELINTQAAAATAVPAAAAVPAAPAAEAAAPGTAAAAPAAPATPAAGTPAPAAPPFQLKLDKSSYSGVEINSVNVPLVGKGLSPGYSFINGYLVIGTSSSIFEKMIDVSQNKGSALKNDANFKKIAAEVSGDVNQLGYINTEKIFDVAVDICNWIISFQQLNVPGAAIAPVQVEATKKILGETVIPILKCLKAVKVVGISTVYTKDGIEQNIVTRIEDTK